MVNVCPGRGLKSRSSSLLLSFCGSTCRSMRVGCFSDFCAVLGGSFFFFKCRVARGMNVFSYEPFFFLCGRRG